MGNSDDDTNAGVGPPASLSDDGRGLDSAATDEIDPSLIQNARALAGSDSMGNELPPFGDDEETATVGPDQAASILAAVNAQTAMPEPSMTDDPPDTGASSNTGDGPGWEAGTVELSSQAAAGAVGEGGLHSSEAVIGSAGVISANAGGGVRPAAATPGSSGIRPAAAAPAVRPAGAPGGGPAARGPVQDVSRPSPPSPGRAEPPQAPQRQATEDVAPVAPDVQPVAAAPKGKTIAGFPAWMVLAGAGAGAFFLILILGMAVTIAVVLSGDSPSAASWVDVSLKISPDTATVTLDGDPEPARVLQLQAGSHTIKIEADGYEAYEGELEVPDSPDVFTFTKSLGSATGDTSDGKPKKKKRGKKKN
jgi:hypothetical protein